MDKQNIIMIIEDLIDDFYVAQVHSEEIQNLLEEFDDDQLQFRMDLETYERERMQPIKEQLDDTQAEHVVTSDANETEEKLPKQ